MNVKDLQQLAQLLDEKLEPLKKDLQQQGKTLQQHTKQLRSLKRDQETILNLLDKEQMSQRKRLTRLEEHVGLSPIS